MEQNITCKTAKFFICTVAYNKTMEDGNEKRVKESFVVDAFTFTEAESRIIEEMQPYMSREFEIMDISKAPFSEIFLTDNAAADRYYKVKVKFLSIDEKTCKEKISTVVYLVQADSTQSAQTNTDKVLGKSMMDYTLASIIETKILDIFLHS